MPPGVARATLSRRGGALDKLDVEAGARQRMGGAKAGDAGADHAREHGARSL